MLSPTALYRWTKARRRRRLEFEVQLLLLELPQWWATRYCYFMGGFQANIQAVQALEKPPGSEKNLIG